ncbi:MAG: class I SAM-dependent methyltransferase [Acetobacteraceae bacterium]|nr:class I SAM-dependent methyltransferase [Acetobacteraceae bacterium]
MLLDKFHCPLCRGALRPFNADYLACRSCNEPVFVQNGVVDFVRGRFDTMLDADQYDETHGVDDDRAAQRYQAIQRFAGDRWPESFGSVLEVGCGTGLFSRALLASGSARDAVLTDVSVAMLSACRDQLASRGLLARIPVAFATYSGEENMFRDAVFDTCAGTSVLHHILDVRGFLAEVFRSLKPGGRALFLEPNLRFHRALMHTLADVVAQLQSRGDAFSQDRQKLHNVLSEGRRAMLHQGDLAFLVSLEDKHMFEADAFEQMGLELGFASAEALPCGVHATGVAVVSTLCSQLGVGDAVRRDVMQLLPAYASRYIGLLSPRDQSSMFLLWLEKGVGPQQRSFRGPEPDEEADFLAEVPPDPAGGLPRQWSFGLEARPTQDGIGLQLSGWCLVNADIRWLRITLEGVTRETPVWRPRPDVQNLVNGNGLYSAWNALCSGVDTELAFEGVAPSTDGLALAIEIELMSGHLIQVKTPERLPLGEPISIAP